MFSRILQGLLLLGAFGLAVFSIGAAPVPPESFLLPAGPHERPDIVLITIDALRVDHVTGYGYDRLTTPALDEFARHAVRFTNAIAQAPYTKASVASLITGLYPSTHKTVTTSVPFPETMTGHLTTKPIVTDVLPDTATTLAEALRAAGYATRGFTANPFLIDAFGFAQGFELFRFYPGGDFASADQLVRDAIEAARKVDVGRPLFTWVHLMEPHSPYVPPPLTAGMFKIGGRPEPLAANVVVPSWLLPGSPRDRRAYVAAYDDEIAAADAAVDVLLHEYASVRLGRDTVIVTTADHGEQFLDHGGWEHSTNLYDELVRVPLAIQAPGLTPRIVDHEVQLIDLFPTLLDYANAPAPASSGRQLTPLLHGAGQAEPALTEIVGSAYALRDDGFKYIAYDDGRAELFDLSADPHEHHSVLGSESQRADRMRSRLDQLLSHAIAMGTTIHGQSAPVDPAIVERLRALGYIQR